VRVFYLILAFHWGTVLHVKFVCRIDLIVKGALNTVGFFLFFVFYQVLFALSGSNPALQHRLKLGREEEGRAVCLSHDTLYRCLVLDIVWPLSLKVTTAAAGGVSFRLFSLSHSEAF